MSDDAGERRIEPRSSSRASVTWTGSRGRRSGGPRRAAGPSARAAGWSWPAADRLVDDAIPRGRFASPPVAGREARFPASRGGGRRGSPGRGLRDAGERRSPGGPRCGPLPHPWQGPRRRGRRVESDEVGLERGGFRSRERGYSSSEPPRQQDGGIQSVESLSGKLATYPRDIGSCASRSRSSRPRGLRHHRALWSGRTACAQKRSVEQTQKDQAGSRKPSIATRHWLVLFREELRKALPGTYYRNHQRAGGCERRYDRGRRHNVFWHRSVHHLAFCPWASDKT